MLCQIRLTYPQSVDCRIRSYRLWVVVEGNGGFICDKYFGMAVLDLLHVVFGMLFWNSVVKVNSGFCNQKNCPKLSYILFQWLADKLQLLLWLTLHSLSIMGKLSPYVVLQVSDSTDFSQIALLKTYFVPYFLPSTVCLSLLNRYIHLTSLQNHSFSVLHGLGRKMG